MRNKKAIVSLVLAASMFLTSSCDSSRKNNILNNNKIVLELNTITENIDSYSSELKLVKGLDTIVKNIDSYCDELKLEKEQNASMEIPEDKIEQTEEPVQEQAETEKKEKYSFGYITCDTGIYNTIFDKEEKMEAYQKVLILKKLDKITLVEYVNEDNETMVGYIVNEALCELSGIFVEVDISDQIIRLYIDNELVLESKIVTGMSYESPTPVGCFDIDEKKSPTFLKGYDGAGNVTYSRFVDYWMPFEGGIGLHDAEYHYDPEWGTYHGWRNPEDFGGNTYTYNGSHGCVNLLNEVAKEIYENVEVGTKVLVHK